MPYLSPQEVASLQIVQMIFHVVGPLEDDYVELDVLVDATPHAPFFLERIEATSRGGRCHFTEASRVQDAVRRIATTPETFLTESRKLAQQFQTLHEGNAKKGVFLFFELAAMVQPEGATEATRIYAFLKLDHEDVLSYTIDDQDGRKVAALSELVNTFVRSREALQKGAVIRVRDGEPADLVVHDRASRRGMSDYFASFLGAKRQHTDAKLTSKVVSIAKKIGSDHFDDLSPEFQKNFVQRIHDVVDSGVAFNAENTDFISATFGPHEEDAAVVRDFHKALREAGIEHERFDFDRSETQRPARNIIRTLENIDIYYPHERRELIEFREVDGRNAVVIFTQEVVRDDLAPDTNRSTR